MSTQVRRTRHGSPVTWVLAFCLLLGVLAGLWVVRSRPAPERASEPTAEEHAAPGGDTSAPRPAPRPVTRATGRPPGDPSSPPPDPAAYNLAMSMHIPLAHLYEKEARDPHWAPAMEGQLQARFTPAIMDRYPGVTPDIECRTSSCRITLSYPEELARQLYPDYLPARDYVGRRIYGDMGAIGPLTSPSKDRQFLRETIFVAFDGKTIDPSSYAALARRLSKIASRTPEEN